MQVIAALLRRRRAPTFHHKRLAAGLLGALSSDPWPHRAKPPATIGAKLVHLGVGIALGAAFTAIILAALGVAL
jgi:hypothetical protein